MNRNEEINYFSFGKSRSGVLTFKRFNFVAKRLLKLKNYQLWIKNKYQIITLKYYFCLDDINPIDQGFSTFSCALLPTEKTGLSKLYFFIIMYHFFLVKRNKVNGRKKFDIKEQVNKKNLTLLS